MDNWSVHLYLLMDSSYPLIPSLFLPMIVVFIGFCLINLILAVIIQSFTAINDAELKEEAANNRRDLVLQEINQ